MSFTTILHQAKSEYAYAYDENTLHLRLKTTKGKYREWKCWRWTHLTGFREMMVL